MPNTSPVNDSPEITRWMQAPERDAVVRAVSHRRCHGRQPGREADRLRRSARRPEPSPSATTAAPFSTTAHARRLRRRRKLNYPVVQHAEDTHLTAGCSMNLGPTSFRLGLRGMPNAAESDIVRRDIALARETKRSYPRRPHLHRRGHGRRAPGQESRHSRHRRGHAAPLHPDRREHWRVRHPLQDEPAAAFLRRSARP